MCHLITFKEYNVYHEGPLVKSNQYENFLAPYDANTQHYADYMVCPYVSGHFCSPDSGLFAIDTEKAVRIDLVGTYSSTTEHKTRQHIVKT